MSDVEYDVQMECDLCGEQLLGEDLDNAMEDYKSGMSACKSCLDMSASDGYGEGFED